VEELLAGTDPTIVRDRLHAHPLTLAKVLRGAPDNVRAALHLRPTDDSLTSVTQSNGLSYKLNMLEKCGRVGVNDMYNLVG
jgi:hypothetical protein